MKDESMPDKYYSTKYKGYYVTLEGDIYREPSKYDRKDVVINEDGLIKLNQFERGGNERNGQYLSVNVSLKSESGKLLKQIRVFSHRLIAETFHENPLNLPEVNHIDKNKQNNSVNNLEWISHKDNFYHNPPVREPNGQWRKR